MNLIVRFLRDTSGATAIEYALIGSLLSIAIVVGATALGSHLNTMYRDVADSFD
ncbi:MAG: Flp family type IVb pilin [Bauldia sp.]